jgi:hypothetical protein
MKDGLCENEDADVAFTAVLRKLIGKDDDRKR